MTRHPTRIHVRLRARPGLARQSLEALSLCEVPYRSLSIMRDRADPGWREVTIEAWPCGNAKMQHIADCLKGVTVSERFSART